jgi:crossover junction endonuclease MUS81
MDYLIKFDNRERDLIKILETKGYKVILENLDLGDIQFIDLSTKEIIIIIERKTLSDLSSSIKDNRYKEQKERLIHGLKNNIRKIMLIEGDDMSDFTLPIKTFNSVIINTLLRDNIHIHQSKSKESTIEFIENIIINLPKYYDDLKNEIINNEKKIFNNEFNCATVKKDNLTPSICFKNMLAQIPGISSNMANVFVNKYKNIKSFIIELDKLNDKKEIIKILADEKYGNRRIGDKVAERIYIFMFNDEEFIQKNNKKQSNVDFISKVSLFS